MNENNPCPVVKVNGFCGKFDRILASLIEEPETCDVCAFYREDDSTCRWPEVQQ